MKKRLFATLLACSITLSVLPAAGAAMKDFTTQQSYSGQFIDVPTTAWYYDSVKTAYELGLVSGTSATTFSPNQTLTADETTAFLARMHAIYHGNRIEELDGAYWANKYYDYVENYIDSSYTGNGIYGKTEEARWTFSYWLSKALPDSEYAAINAVADGQIADVSADTLGVDVANRIYMLYRAGIVVGNDSDGTFAPNSSITRAEVAAILVRMVDPSQRVKFEQQTSGYKMETIYNVTDVRSMLVTSDGSLYYATRSGIYKDGELVFDGIMPMTLEYEETQYADTYGTIISVDYENWFPVELATDAQHERVYALMVALPLGTGRMVYDVKNQNVLSAYVDDQLFSYFGSSAYDPKMGGFSVIDSIGALIFEEGASRWDLSRTPKDFIDRHAMRDLDLDNTHLGYSGGDLIGLSSGGQWRGHLVRYNLNESSVEEISVSMPIGKEWNRNFVASDYGGKFYTIPSNGFQVLCIDPAKQICEVVVDSAEIQILDGIPLRSDGTVNCPNIIAAGQNCWYLFYPASECIRKLSPMY